MPKPRPRFRHRPAVLLMRCKKSIEGNLSQHDDHADVAEQPELLNEVRPAALKFNSARFIPRRRAPDRRGNVTINEFQTVVSMSRLRLISKSHGVKRSVEPVAAAISGKNSPGAITAMGRRRQTHDKQPCIKIAKPRQRSRPIFFALVPPRRIARDRFAPPHQPRTFAASGYSLMKLLNALHRMSVSTKPSRWSMLLSSSSLGVCNLQLWCRPIQTFFRSARTDIEENESHSCSLFGILFLPSRYFFVNI